MKQSNVDRPRRRRFLNDEEITKLHEFVNGFDTKQDCIEFIGIERNTLNDLLERGYASPATIETVFTAMEKPAA